MDKLFLERASALTLNRLFGYAPKLSQLLIRTAGSATDVFSLDRGTLQNLCGKRADALLDRTELEKSFRELEKYQARGWQFVPVSSSDYPELLRECDDCPAGLYVLACSPVGEIFNGKKTVSIVGTRDISPYGTDCCRQIVKALATAQEKPVIVSGLAIGVDICAHRAALENGLSTIAVMPCGPDTVYPRTHCAFATQLAMTPGSALVTDYPPLTEPRPVNFLRRNRIIAALGESCILVESKIHGGGRITCQLAFDYGRNVFALPGRIDDVRSQGCNDLIHRKLAEPITDCESLCNELGLKSFNRKRSPELEQMLRERYHGRKDLESIVRIVLCVKANRGICLEELASTLGMTYADVSGITALLQTDGIIEMDILSRCILVNNA